MHSKNDFIEIIISGKGDEVIEELFQSILSMIQKKMVWKYK